MLLSNHKVLEKVEEVSEMMKSESDFNLKEFIQEESSAAVPMNIQKKMQNEAKKFEFNKQVIQIRRKENNPSEDDFTEHTVGWCMLKLKKRIEMYDSLIAPDLESEGQLLQRRLAARQKEVVHKHYSICIESADYQKGAGKLNRSFNPSTFQRAKTTVKDNLLGVPGAENNARPKSSEKINNHKDSQEENLINIPVLQGLLDP
jgi:hypothetical protein